MDTDRFTVTRKGIVIGGHFIAPPPEPSRDAELVQDALLRTRRIQAPAANEPSHAPVTTIGHRVVFAVCVAILVFLYVEIFK